ncbi:ATP-binding cassette sub- D member 4 [Haplosporangium sp. Z 27]|nr:ATP-binding cassette sub- D member 4 [Haplosporangium sp. Z 27]
MYRLLPTEDNARDDDRTVSGSVRDGFVDSSSNQKKSRFQFIKDAFKSRPSFLSTNSSNSSWKTKAAGAESSTGFTLPKKKDQYLIDGLFVKRLGKLLGILFTRHSKVTLLYISMTVFCIVNEAIVYLVGTIPSKYYKVLGDKDSAAFWFLLSNSLFTVFLAGFIYLRPKLFYRILFMHDEEVDNPYVVLKTDIENCDQRITQDIDKIAESFSKMVQNLVIIPLLIGFYTWQCWKMTGHIGPLCIYGYFILSTIASRLLINPIVDAVFYKEAAEGYFRFLHVRFRQFSESITFSRGEDEAKESADDMLEILLKTQLDVIHKELPLKFLQESVSYFGSILSYVIIAIPIFWGVYDGLPPSDISAVISKTSFVSMYLTYQFSKIIQCATDFSDLAGYTSRMGQLMEALDEINVEIENIAIDFPHEEAFSHDSSIHFENVSITTPTGDLVISDFEFRFEIGLSTMIVGPNGAGKTSLLRAMGGLWPVSKGQIIMPHSYRKDVIFLPQTSYLTYGTLREQIVYPNREKASSLSDADVLRILKLACLENVIELIDDYDFTYTHDWHKMLSPGEQQKMAFARLFYARPVFAVLDEATSSMDSDTEKEMFKQCRLLNITCITVAHNEGLERFHQQKVILEGRGGDWSFAQIQEQDQDHDDQDGQGSNFDQGPAVSSQGSPRISFSLPGDATFDSGRAL